MFFSKNKLNCLKIGLTAIFTLSSLFSIRADDNEKLAAHHHFNQPKPKNLFIEWNAGATNFDFHAEATMTIFNNDTRTALSPGEFVDGVFVPAWRIYFNQPYTTAPSETRVTVAESDITLNYFVMTPNESFGTIPPGGSITLNMETGFSNAVIFGIFKLSKDGSSNGMHIQFGNSSYAHFIPIKTNVDINNPAVMSRLPLALSFFGIADAVPPDTPNTRYPQGTPDLNLTLQQTIIPNPTYLVEGVGGFNVNSIHAVNINASCGGCLSFEKEYLKDILSTLPCHEGNSHIRLGLTNELIPNLPPTPNGQNAPGSYFLQINPADIQIIGADPAGVFYGIQTLRQLIFKAVLDESYIIPVLTISDAPRFPVRGNLLDVGRHFVPMKQLLKYIDLLSMFKINRFHWHVTEDQGWRIEIPGIPELTKYGSKRTFNPAELNSLSPAFASTTQLSSKDNILGKPKTVVGDNFGVVPTWQGFEDALNNFIGNGTGYYSTSDVIEVLRYAADRHIEVQMEVDMPAHARAAIMSMEYRYRKYADSNPEKANEYRLIDPLDPSPAAASTVNPCLESTYNFLDKVVKEIAKMYRKAGVPFKYFHMGGDEVPGQTDNTTWPLCQGAMTSAEKLQQFLVRYNEIVSSYGASTQAWAESTEIELSSPNTPLKNAGVVTQVWNNIAAPPPQGQAYDFANNGFPVILSHVSNLYIDAMQAKNPREIGPLVAGFVGTKEVFSYVPENYIISYIKTNIFGDPLNILGPLFGQIIDPVVLSRTQTALQPSAYQNILGIETALWGEFRKTYPSTEYMGFPRIIAGAERAWNQNPPVNGFTNLALPDPALAAEIQAKQAQIEQAWLIFANALGKYTLPMLDYYPRNRPTRKHTRPVNYKIQPPGAIIQGGILYMNNMFPGLKLQFSLDNGSHWITYTGPVPVPGPVMVRSVNRIGLVSWEEPVSP